MEPSKSPWARLALAVAITAIVVVVVRDRMEAGESQAWERLAQARVAGFGIENLEDLRQEVAGTSAEPWVAFHLAMQFYDSGTDYDRARQVAEAAIESFPDHATAPLLVRLVDAVKSYQSGS